MEIIIALIIGIIAGFFCGNFYAKSKQASQPQSDDKQQIAALQAQIAAERSSHDKAVEELRRSGKEQLTLALEQQKEAQKKMLEQEREQLANSFKTLADEILKDKADNLNSKNSEQIAAILNPLNIKMKEFEDAVKAQQKSSTEDRENIVTNFKASIEALARQTEKISGDAENLTKALKNNSKVQGDWGEMILESILEQSGLRKDEEYFIQKNFKTEEGKNERPDVVVRFPENRCVIIDSKVSLTAYTDYVNCDDDEQKAGFLQAHVNSVKKHIDELAEKDYSGLVDDSIGYVLMFIPNESSYLCAIQAENNLITEAYAKHIIIISPSNLMMALQLAYNLWQYDRQTKNVMKIVDRGGKLYDKIAVFVNSFEEVIKNIHKAEESATNAMNQLTSGRGNVVSQCETLRKLGAKTTKQISVSTDDENEDE